MLDRRFLVKLEQVRRDELEDIRQRRAHVGLSNEDVGRDLCGLALSGGGLRSASFSMGILQALHRAGLWRYIDYLSTVSGGGYIGGFLTSCTLRALRKFDRNHFPLKEEPGHRQPLDVQRFTYGGHYLVRPWLLFNKWLIGLFLINLALFSGMFCICALVAFLWRCLDYFWIRDVALLLGLGNDLQAPFWPFVGFAVGWLVAWLASFWRRGAESLGRVARYFLYLTVPAFLVGCALLIGNGDIAGLGRLDWLFGKETISFGVEVWAPLVGLVLGGLFPFLRPKRLLQSGISPQKPWERAVFGIASAALLVGLPLLIIGALARENISGYNDHPYRDVVRGDIDNWPSLVALILPHRNHEPGTAAAHVLHFRESLARMPDASELTEHSAGRSDDGMCRTQTRIESLMQLAQTSRSAEDRNGRRDSIVSILLDQAKNPAAQNGGVPDPDEAQSASNEPFRSAMEIRSHLDYLIVRWQPDEYSRLEPQSRTRAREQAEFFDKNALGLAKSEPWFFLYLRAYELELVSQAALQRRTAVMNDDDFHRWSFLPNYIDRLYHVTGWLVFNENNPVRAYWEAKTRQELLQDQICSVLNQHLLTDQVLLDVELEDRVRAPGNGARAASEQDASGSASSSAKTAYDTQRETLVQYALHEGAERLQPHEVQQLNRLLLEQNISGVFRPRSEVRRLVSIHEDQWSRLKWFLISLVVFLIAMSVDVNGVSLHHYYRDRIVQAFIRYKNEKTRSIPLSELNTTEFGSPYHLISGTVHIPRRRLLESDNRAFRLDDRAADDQQQPEEQQPEEEQPVAQQRRAAAGDSPVRRSRRRHAGDDDQRWTDAFLFSRKYCGAQITGYATTEIYEQSVVGELNKIDLADSIAISGAAISPGHVRNWLVAFLMLMFNLRLGQWLPNPRHGTPRTRPRVFALLAGLFRPAAKRSYCFVTDGGISENLGLVQLLRRKCSLIIAVDAGCDPKHDFDDLARAIRTARIHGGVRLVALEKDNEGRDQDLFPSRIQLQPAGNQENSEPKGPGLVQDHWLMARILYADREEPGLLIYIKPSFTGDESVDLLQYRARHSSFPHESSADQIFDESQVESYRQLGYHIGTRLCDLLPLVRAGQDLWDQPQVDVGRIRQWFTREQESTTEAELHGDAQPTETLPEPVDVVARTLTRLRAEIHFPADLEASHFSAAIDGVSEDSDDVLQSIRAAMLDESRSMEDRLDCAWLLLETVWNPPPSDDGHRTLEAYCHALKSGRSSAALRAAAADALGLLGKNKRHRAEVCMALKEALHDEDADVRLRAKLALASLSKLNLRKSPKKNAR